MDRLVLNTTIAEQGFPFVLDDVRQILGGRVAGATNTKGLYDGLDAVATGGYTNRILSGCAANYNNDMSHSFTILPGYVLYQGSIRYFPGDTIQTVFNPVYYFTLANATATGDRTYRETMDVSPKVYEPQYVTLTTNSASGFKFCNTTFNPPSVKIYDRNSASVDGSNNMTISNSGSITLSSNNASYAKNDFVITQEDITISKPLNVSTIVGTGGVSFEGNKNVIFNANINVPCIIGTGDLGYSGNPKLNVYGDIYLGSAPQGVFSQEASTVFIRHGSAGLYYGITGGNIIGSDTFLRYDESDKNLKTDIKELPHALGTVLSLESISYKWNDTYVDKYIKSTGIHLHPDATEKEKESYDKAIQKYKDSCSNTEFGYIAQDVKEIVPELVVEGEDGFLSINYTKMIPILTNAIKEQQTMITERDIKISELENRILTIEKKMN